jgi:hypothetical protein
MRPAAGPQIKYEFVVGKVGYPMKKFITINWSQNGRLIIFEMREPVTYREGST